jgi:carboxypeptidase Q
MHYEGSCKVSFEFFLQVQYSDFNFRLMTPLNATAFEHSDDGPDTSMWTTRGFPGISPLTRNEKYFWYHHTNADRMEVEDPDALDKCTALWASTAYVVADLSINLPRTLEGEN